MAKAEVGKAVVERGDSRGALSRAVNHRLTALCGRAVDRLAVDPRLEDKIVEAVAGAPAKEVLAKLGELGALIKSLNPTAFAEDKQGGNTFNFNNFQAEWLASVRRVNAEAEVIDVTPERVQSGSNDQQVIDNEW